MSNLPANNGGTSSGGVNLELTQLLQQQSQLNSIQLQQSQQPSTFRRVLGAVVGMAGNAFVPGLGGALGSLVGGGLGAGGGLGGIFGGGSPGVNIAAAEQQLNAENQQNQQLFALAEQSNTQLEATTLTSNLLKAKHAATMSVIQNIGS